MRKRRTRGHIIEDLGFNCIELPTLLSGYVLEKTKNDYGFDAYLYTFDEVGQIEDGHINIQLKSTDNIEYDTLKKSFVFDLSKKDLEYWLNSWLPAILVLYDAKQHLAYFIDLQAYFNENSIFLVDVKKYIRIFIPKLNQFNQSSLFKLRKLKNEGV